MYNTIQYNTVLTVACTATYRRPILSVYQTDSLNLVLLELQPRTSAALTGTHYGNILIIHSMTVYPIYRKPVTRTRIRLILLRTACRI